MTPILERLMAASDLDEAEAGDLFAALASPGTSAALAGAYLAALRTKGESASELRGLARAMRASMSRCDLGDADLVDVVGTGGDHARSFNLSTGAALLAAAAGAPVAKHGSGAVSGRSGAADVLAALGVPLPDGEAAARSLFEATGFTFLHAPSFHPALAGVGPVRRALGTRTVFNLLGPLCNPAGPAYALIGAATPAAARLIAEVAADLPFRRVFVVHGAAAWDEPTPIGPFVLYDVSAGRIERTERDPLAAGFPRCAPGDLRGGDASFNALALRRALSGERGPHRDALVLGAALALEVSGHDDSVPLAAAAIDDGSASALLTRLAAWRHDA
ncbi:MAG TPA: anthranilate phosphoribosyltransferase [Candidatus Polarisedimenticolaceae bacterium]|nr:anthranilate phosphoribosyltransferase [Candidatus Polarisedimenticolaceae bacterium]